MITLEGKRALVTGGATGLGLAMGQAMAEAGAHVIAVSRRTPESLPIPGAAHYAHDVTDTGAAGPLVERIEREHGPIDILVNNAGNHLKKPIEQMTVEEYQSILDVHLTGAFALTRAVVPGMRARGGGSVLFTASMVSYFGMPDVIGYSTAKSGIMGLVHSLAVELGPSGIRVNAIAPGWMLTPMFATAVETDPERKRKILDRTPLGRFGDPADVGQAAVYLSSDAASFVTGATLPVDGGVLIGF